MVHLQNEHETFDKILSTKNLEVSLEPNFRNKKPPRHMVLTLD